DVAGAVVAHRLDIEAFEDVQRLQHGGSLRPLRQLVDLDAAILCHYWLFYFDAPVGQVRQRDEPTFFLQTAHKLLRDIAAIESIVRRHDRVVPPRSLAQRLLLGFHQLTDRRGELDLPPDRARPRPLRPL